MGGTGTGGSLGGFVSLSKKAVRLAKLLSLFIHALPESPSPERSFRTIPANWIRGFLLSTLHSDEERFVKVIIADDDHQHVFLLEMFLKKWGYEVVSTDRGEEALRLLRNENSSCVAILDWEMRGLTGIEICREIRKSFSNSKIITCMLTAHAQLRDRQQAAEAGADVYMTKPYEPEELKTRLQEASLLLESDHWTAGVH